MDTSIILLIVQIPLLLANLYLVFFKSYITEKGKTLATLEDIERLTKKVEDTKNQSQLSHQNRLSINIQTQDALHDFHDKYMLWLHAIVHMSEYSFFPECHDISQLNASEENLDKLHMSYMSSFEKISLLLFKKQPDFVLYVKYINRSTLYFQRNVIFKSARFKDIIRQYPIEKESYTKKEELVDYCREKDSDDIENRYKNSQEMKEKLLVILENIAA